MPDEPFAIPVSPLPSPVSRSSDSPIPDPTWSGSDPLSGPVDRLAPMRAFGIL